jgi:uncharacterized protein
VRIHRYTDPQLFLDHSQEWLLQSELRNSSMLAVVHLLIKGDHPFVPPFYMATVETEAGIVGCAVRTPPDSLLLAGIPLEAIPLLASDIETVYAELPGVTGMEKEAQAFAKHWQPHRGNSVTVNHWCWYALEQVVAPDNPASGELRLAEPSDLELVRAWAPRFASETNTLVDVVGFFERRVRTGSLYIWCDQAPCSLVAISAVTPSSVRISGVYTTPEYRLKGYASTAVASVSQLMLDAGHRYCVLFADGSDPHANSMYQVIGYEPIFNNVNICLADRLLA